MADINTDWEELEIINLLETCQKESNLPLDHLLRYIDKHFDSDSEEIRNSVNKPKKSKSKGSKSSSRNSSKESSSSLQREEKEEDNSHFQTPMIPWRRVAKNASSSSAKSPISSDLHAKVQRKMRKNSKSMKKVANQLKKLSENQEELRSKLLQEYQEFQAKYLKYAEINQLSDDLQGSSIVEPESSEVITAISYNCLAQQYLDTMPYLYYKNSKRYKNWPARFSNLKKFFKNHPADIYCLQEVQNRDGHLADYIKFFSSQQTSPNISYECVYAAKPNHKPDGCMTVFNSNRFNLLYSQVIHYQVQNLFSQASDNVGQIVLLENKLSENKSSLFLVANTHLVYNPKQAHVKLYQISKLIYEMSALCYYLKNNAKARDLAKSKSSVDKTELSSLLHSEYQTEKMKFTAEMNAVHHGENPEHTSNGYFNSNIPTILCGDFNSREDSGLWRFICQNNFNPETNELDRMEFSGQKVPKLKLSSTKLSNTIPSDLYPKNQNQESDHDGLFYEQFLTRKTDDSTNNHFAHNLNLQACYSVEECSNSYTQTDSRGLVVDHIFENGCQIIEKMALLDKRDFRSSELPGAKFGSDHMPVGVKFVVNY